MNVCFLCICVCLCLLVCLLVSLYASQHKCLWKVHEISVCIFSLRCNLSVWHCYLGSILAFNIEIQISYNLWIKPLHQLRLTILIFFLDLCFIPRFGCIYIYISFVIKKFWWIDWLEPPPVVYQFKIIIVKSTSKQVRIHQSHCIGLFYFLSITWYGWPNF